MFRFTGMGMELMNKKYKNLADDVLIYNGMKLNEASGVPVGANSRSNVVATKEDNLKKAEEVNDTPSLFDDNSVKEFNQMSEKTVEKSVVIGQMSPDHKDYYDSLAKKEQDLFLDSSYSERDSLVAKSKEKDKVIYKSADGTEYRVSDGEAVAKIAREKDEMAKTIKEMQEKSDNDELTQRVKEYGIFKEDSDLGKSVLKAFDSISDESQKEAALSMLGTFDSKTVAALSRKISKSGEGDNVPARSIRTKEDAEAEVQRRADKLVDSNKEMSQAEAISQVYNKDKELYAIARGMNQE